MTLIRSLTLLILLSLICVSDCRSVKQQYICEDFDTNSSINGVLELKNSTKLVFKSSDVWTIDPTLRTCNKSKVYALFGDRMLADGFDAIGYYPRNEMTFIFKSERWWGLKESPQGKFVVYNGRKSMKILFDGLGLKSGRSGSGIDAAFFVMNPNYDGFTNYDYLYIFEGQRITIHGLYFFSGLLHTTNLTPLLGPSLQLSDISGQMPNSVDSAFNDHRFVYLFKDSRQYLVSADRFKPATDISMTFDNLKNISLIVEPQLHAIIEKSYFTIVDQLILDSIFFVNWLMKVLNTSPALVMSILVSVALSVLICIFIIVLKYLKFCLIRRIISPLNRW